MRAREGQIQINQRRTGENFPGIVWLLKNYGVFLQKFQSGKKNRILFFLNRFFWKILLNRF